MKKLYALFPLFALGCQIPLPGGKVPDCVNAQLVDGSVILAECADGGVGSGGGSGASGTGGGSGAGGMAGHSHGGASGQAGSGGQPHHVAGAGGAAGHTGHSGLPVTEPLPPFRAGSTTFDVRRTGELPAASVDSSGNFRTVCEATHYAWDDAIVYPGQSGRAHLHMFFGNDKADAHSTYESLRSSGGGSCRGGTANRSAYWVPALLAPDGRVIEPVEIHTYYKSGFQGLAPAQVTEFPVGIRLVAGDMSASPSNPQNALSFGWKCVNGGGNSRTPPNCPGDQVEMHVTFPQCWDGRLDSPDHKSHVVRPQQGRCPATHPRAIPELSFHVRYQSVPAGSRLSSDTYDGPGGHSVHGDWMEAWDPSLPPVFLAGCITAHRDCGSHKLSDGRVIF